MSDKIPALIEETFRNDSGRILATLIGTFRDFELAEEVMQEAFVTALESWTADGVPSNPAAWITTTARHTAIDRLRRADTYRRKTALLQEEAEHAQQLRHQDEMNIKPLDSDDADLYPDERLKLIFTCCHPALAQEARTALTLHTLGGITTEEIARAYLVPVPTMAQRLVRAKHKIKQAGIPYRVPPRHLLTERTSSVLTTIYLIFNEGYSATKGDDLIRHDLCDEAIRLGRLLMTLLTNLVESATDAPYTEQLQSVHKPEAMGLLALMLLHHSRRNTRVAAGGELVTLEEQNRTLWDRVAIDEGLAILEQALHLRQPGPYQIQAAIGALHARAAAPQETDWPQIVLLYDELYRHSPSSVVALNRAVAVAMARGPIYGLALIDRLEAEGELTNYHLLHAARADLLRRAGFLTDAVQSYQVAIGLVENRVERAYLAHRIAEVEAMLN